MAFYSHNNDLHPVLLHSPNNAKTVSKWIAQQDKKDSAASTAPNSWKFCTHFHSEYSDAIVSAGIYLQNVYSKELKLYNNFLNKQLGEPWK